MKRRELIKGGLLAAVGGIFPLTAGCAPGMAAGAAAPLPAPGALPVARARNIVFYAYDGLTYEDLATARYFAQRHQEGRVLALERLLGRGAAGSMLPHSLTSVVTDSAAATTAWPVGRKVVNGALSMYPDGWLLTIGNPSEPQTLNLNYATGAHTAGPVPVAVYGAGTGRAGLGVVDNTELFGWMTHALGVRFENPLMTEAEALRLTSRAEERELVMW